MAVIVVVSGVYVKVKLPVACVCPSGIVIVGETSPTAKSEENNFKIVPESGFLAGCPGHLEAVPELPGTWSCLQANLRGTINR